MPRCEDCGTIKVTRCPACEQTNFEEMLRDVTGERDQLKVLLGKVCKKCGFHSNGECLNMDEDCEFWPFISEGSKKGGGGE